MKKKNFNNSLLSKIEYISPLMDNTLKIIEIILMIIGLSK